MSQYSRDATQSHYTMVGTPKTIFLNRFPSQPEIFSNLPSDMSSSLTDEFGFLFVCLFFRAVPLACKDSQARGRIGTTAAGLHHSHSNAGSETATHGNVRSLTNGVRARIQPATCTLTDTSQIHFHCATLGTPTSQILNRLSHRGTPTVFLS